jgi:hypothetical protein
MKRSAAWIMTFLWVMLLVPICMTFPVWTLAASEKETVYKVVWPLGKTTDKVVPLAPRLDSLDGKTICFVGPDDRFVLFPELEKLLKEKYTGMKFIPQTAFPGPSGTSLPIDKLMPMYKKQGCNAIISGIGV